MDRRAFLRGTGGVVAGAAVFNGFDPTRALASSAAPRQVASTVSPFTLGVASGDPTSSGVVLWTRLAPDPLTPGGGMPPEPVPLDWEVAEDETFANVVQRGTASAVPEDAHTAHIEVTELSSDRPYWYRFRANGEISPAGRTRTTPLPDASPAQVRFATASCQHYQSGYYTAHQALADEDLAFVVFLGDYIYEGAPDPDAPRQHDGVGEPITLDEYRSRHARYKSDPDLQHCHGSFPWFVTFDDHEIDNNWADEIPQDPDQQPHDQFIARRIAAFKAYWEHMPLPPQLRPHERDINVYRRFAWGDLLQVDVLDTRQYRSDQPVDLGGANDPAAAMLGAGQEEWLQAGLAGSTSLWNCIAQQTMVAQNDRQAGPDERYDFDNWDGYRVPRQRLMDDLMSVPNPVVVTGDRHATWVCDLKQDFYDPDSTTVGAELTGSSICSGGDDSREDFHAFYDPIMVDSPHWKFIDNGRGYLLCDLDRQRWLTDLRVVSTVLAPEAEVSTFAQFVTEAGQRGVSVV